MTPQTQALAEQVLSPLTGVIKGLRLLPAQANPINLYHCVGMMPNYGELPCGRDISRSGGVGESVEEAVITTLFEGLERYCGALLDRKRLHFGRAASDAYLLGDRLPLFAPWQYEQPDWPFRALTPDSEIHWMPASSLLDGEERMVPAGLVYVPYLPTSLQDNLCLSTSTGMAAGNNLDQVLLSGLLEVVERDAFMIMWLNRLSLPRIELDPASRAAQLLGAKLKPLDARLTLVDLTTDIGIPTVMAVLEQRAFGHPVTALGMACKADYASAAIKAFFEAASSYGRICFHFEQNGRQLPVPRADGADFHGLEMRDILYTVPELRERLAFITASTEIRQLGEAPVIQGRTPAERLTHALHLVRPHAPEVVAVDLATRDITELGVKVQRVLAPELVPLTSDQRFPWLGHRRIYEAPVRMGRRARPARLDELNHDPHPFA